MEFHVPQDRIRIFIPGFDSNPTVNCDFFLLSFSKKNKTFKNCCCHGAWQLVGPCLCGTFNYCGAIFWMSAYSFPGQGWVGVGVKLSRWVKNVYKYIVFFAWVTGGRYNIIPFKSKSIQYRKLLWTCLNYLNMLNKAILFTTSFVFDVPFEGLVCSNESSGRWSINTCTGRDRRHLCLIQIGLKFYPLT